MALVRFDDDQGWDARPPVAHPPAPAQTFAPQPAPTMGWAPAPGATPPASSGLDPSAVVAGWMSGNNPQGHQDASYWLRRMQETGGLNAGNLEYWKGRFLEAPGTHQEGGGGYGGTNVFSDPATKQWEQLVNGLVGKLNTPYTPPGYDQMIGQLNNYFQRLQGPAYTPAQMDLIQTQSTDPLMQQRDNAKQSILQDASAHGLTPDSGIVQKRIDDSNQRYGVANTQNQARFATDAIGLDRQNAATAAQIGPQISALQQGNYQYNLGNQQQAASVAQQVPNEAWRRLTGANSLIDPLNAGGLLNTQNYYQQQGYNQSNEFVDALMRLLSGYFR
jgi:hypothetical protein